MSEGSNLYILNGITNDPIGPLFHVCKFPRKVNMNSISVFVNEHVSQKL